jgi:hypothetical protein
MTADELKAFQKTEPFKPFRLILTDGKTYDIPHPNFIWVLNETARVGKGGDVSRGLWDRYEEVELVRISKVAPVTGEAVPGTSAN